MIGPQTRERIKRLNGATCHYYRLSWARMRAHTRVKEECEARQVLMYLLSRELGLGRMDVGRVLQRDQSTVTHAINKISRLVTQDRLVRGAVETIRLYYSVIDREKQAA